MGKAVLYTKLRLNSIIRFFIISIVLIFAIKFFQSTPYEKDFFKIHAVFLGLIIIFTFIFILDTIVKNKQMNSIIVYFLFLMIVTPIYSAIMSNIEFGQPLTYGLLTQRGWAVIGVGIYLYYLILSKKNILLVIEKVFVILSWISLLYFTYLYFTFDPNSIDSDSNFARVTVERGLRLKLNEYFITFGIVYYFIKFNSRKTIKFLLYFILFVSYALFIIQGRTYILEIFLTLVIYLYKDTKFSTFIIKIFIYLIAIMLFIFFIFTIYPEYLYKMADLFMQMITVLTGELSKDNSANARIYESAIVLNYFEAHPSSLWLGTGQLSHQWNNGYESIFGYFFPADIGLLGGLFQYGVIGIFFLWLIPLYFSYRLIKRKPMFNSYFIQTLEYLLIYYMIRSINTGNYLLFIHEYIVIFFILYGSKFFNEKGKRNDNEE